MKDASVFSLQWLELPDGSGKCPGAVTLFERYLEMVRGFTFSLVRPTLTPEGVDFRLLSSSLSLLSFSAPKFHAGDKKEEVRLTISGGLLVQSRGCGRGAFSFSVGKGGGGLRLTLQLSDYCPLLLGDEHPSLLRKVVYRLTQAYIHKVLTVKFLSGLYRELTGRGAPLQVREVQVREGTAT